MNVEDKFLEILPRKIWGTLINCTKQRRDYTSINLPRIYGLCANYEQSEKKAEQSEFIRDTFTTSKITSSALVIELKKIEYDYISKVVRNDPVVSNC